jgi:CheY-like chemotaxis protein
VRVLLVEDDAETRTALATALRETRATVTPVDSAAAAVAAFQKGKVDLLISDIGMPGEDGYSLIRRIRAIEAETGAKRIPALALTAFVSEEDQRKALASGFDRHLGKPIEPDQLRSTLQDMLAP